MTANNTHFVFYIDGYLDITSVVGNLTVNAEVTIGSRQHSATVPATWYYHGYIAELMIYNGTFDTNQISTVDYFLRSRWLWRNWTEPIPTTSTTGVSSTSTTGGESSTSLAPNTIQQITSQTGLCLFLI